jgi:hypothetical protein
MACPICKSQKFYIKNPDDDFDIQTFEYQNEQLRFDDPDMADTLSEQAARQEVFCQRCSWHGDLKKL